MMKKVISASRRTDLVAFFPEWLSSAIKTEKALVYGPSTHTYLVNLSPAVVHTVVLWSKNFSNLIENKYNLLNHIKKYDQLYLHFCITGLGGSLIECGVPPSSIALSQLEPLLKIVGKARRISIRFDPVVYWKDHGKIKTNLYFFEKLAPLVRNFGIKDIRISFAQWYRKAKIRAKRQNFTYVDPSYEEKKKDARYLAGIARDNGLNLFSCSQDFLSEVPGISPSSCIDGFLLQSLHPARDHVSQRKDKTQRKECRCTESIDIGSYTQACPHCCLYCYANPKI